MSAAFIPTIVMSLVMGLGFYTCLSLSPIAILFCHHCIISKTYFIPSVSPTAFSVVSSQDLGKAYRLINPMSRINFNLIYCIFCRKTIDII